METSPVKAGQILAGKYRIERVLGEGGMGVVVEAYDTGLERRVAIKFLLPEYVQHPEAIQRFMREARAAVKIQSEHVARVIDVSTLETGSPYMVMEFLEGSDLSQVIEAAGPIPVEDTALYLIQACEALAEAHANGIIHRDLKPANLFLAQQAGGSRKIKVLDFGISKTLSATDPGLLGSLTRTSSMMGSPLYMSPEQMKSSRDVDLRTDIWALGVILYESLSGKTPFTGGSIPEISAKILLEDPPSLLELRPELPPTLADVVTRALRKQPELRFPNVGELAMALLPFAPNRARNNVERIIRVLNAAGMAKGEFLASLAPNGSMQFVANPVDILRIESVGPMGLASFGSAAKRRLGTLANFGQTHTERAPSARRRLILAALASVLTIGTGLALLLRSGATPPAAARDRTSAAATPVAGAAAPLLEHAPVAAAVAMPRLTDPVPPPPDLPAEPNAPEPQRAPAAVVTTLEPPHGAALATPPSEQPASAPVARAAAPRTPHAAPTARKAGPNTGSRAREKSYPGDFKSKFGGRK